MRWAPSGTSLPLPASARPHGRAGQHRRLNQVGRQSYGEATGVTQTTRNFGASVGLAALGTLFTAMVARRLTSDLVRDGVPRAKAAQIVAGASQSQFGGSKSLGGQHSSQALAIADDAVAYGMHTVLIGMAVIMAVAFLVALVGLRRGLHYSADAEQAGEGQPAGVTEPSGLASGDTG